MDIICAKTGKHFNDVSVLNECQKHCDRCSIPTKTQHPTIKPDIFANVIWLDEDKDPNEKII